MIFLFYQRFATYTFLYKYSTEHSNLKKWQWLYTTFIMTTTKSISVVELSVRFGEVIGEFTSH